MKRKRPYKHILKNLLHEQATEIIPLLLPEFRVTQAFDVELPELKTTPLKRSPNALEKGLAGLALPEAEVLEVHTAELIEHTGNFERAYRIQDSQTTKPSYLVIEFQTEREDDDLSGHLLRTYVRVLIHAGEDVPQEDDVVETEEGTVRNQAYYVNPIALCPFPQNVPAPIRSTFQGQVLLAFNFRTVDLWEKDAREFLNTHVSAIYFLLPTMKNADATLLGLAIEELAQQFSANETELGRHLTGLSLLLQRSETMSEEEKLATQEHLQRFKHLIKNEPDEVDA